MDRHRLTTGVQLGVRMGVAAGLAVVTANILKLEYPLFALVAAVITTDLDPTQSRALGFQRLVATAIGAVCGAALSMVLPAGPIAIGCSILTSVLICELLQARDVAKLTAFICGVIVLDQSDEPWRYAFLRFIDTTLGILIAWMISYVPKLIRVEQPENESGS